MSPDDRLMDAAMGWLRAVLVPPPPPAVPTPHSPSDEQSRRWRFRDPAPIVVPAPATDERAAARAARRALDDALQADPPPRFSQLGDRLGMTPFERDVALLCFAHAVSTEIARRCAAMPESTAGAPTFALAMGLALDPGFDAASSERRAGLTRVAAEPEWTALAPDRPLRRWPVVRVSQASGQALVSAPLRMEERLVNHVRGHDHLDARLAALVAPVPVGAAPSPDTALSESQARRLDAGLMQLRATVPRGRLLVQVPGGDAPTKRLFVAHLARACGRELYELALPHLSSGESATVVDLWNREVRLQDVALLVRATELGPETTPALARLVAGLTGLVLLDVTELLPDVDTALVLDVARPEPAEQRALWCAARPALEPDWCDRLAGQFDLNPGGIAAAAAAAEGVDDPEQRGERVWNGCRERARPQLEGLAQRVTTTTRLAQVQLPAREKRLLEQVRDQARHRVRVYDGYGFRTRLARGLGITVLLAGESGTGKTMAAEALANELGLDLYRIDVPGVVDKYIGETEKNLRRIFDAAEQSGAVLLFDEADALFGRRSEVRDSHDRYANIEVGYLLTRMESYAGLAVLTTNMDSALDPAFTRRLRFVLTLPFPGAPERKRIWRDVFPPDPDDPFRSLVPGADALDWAALARPALTGGQIRNVALDAAFRAAAGPGVVTMELLREAARDELRKGGRAFVAPDYAGWVTRKDEPVPTAVGATP